MVLLTAELFLQTQENFLILVKCELQARLCDLMLSVKKGFLMEMTWQYLPYRIVRVLVIMLLSSTLPDLHFVNGSYYDTI